MGLNTEATKFRIDTIYLIFFCQNADTTRLNAMEMAPICFTTNLATDSATNLAIDLIERDQIVQFCLT